MALESICMLMREPYTDWKSIKQIIMKENFIPTIANFSTEDITNDDRNKMKRDYMSRKEYNFETVNHAIAQKLGQSPCTILSYADMLKRVDPLRKELKDLKTKAEDTRQKGEELTKIIAELEASIAKYIEEYAMVISDASVIKNDLSIVEKNFLLCLRHLEKSLLTALNEVKGRILDNNRIITELETLKEEAAEVQRKMEETDTIMAEVDSLPAIPASLHLLLCHVLHSGVTQSGSFLVPVFLVILPGHISKCTDSQS
uniref:Dynein heavy chain ATP-binding dynein motor region domain-containing protein n=1 Tax=Amphimedon queenslandica TaxID=400682 RepID=A0A1X7TDT2_AMPQE